LASLIVSNVGLRKQNTVAVTAGWAAEMAEVLTSRAFLIFFDPSTHPQQSLRVRFFAYCTQKRASVVGVFHCGQFDQGDKLFPS